MKTQSTLITNSIRRKTFLIVGILTIYSASCGVSPTEQPMMTSPVTPSATAEPLISLPALSPSSLTATPLLETPLPPAASATPSRTFKPVPTSALKAGWIDFVNDYYGYTITLPPTAIIHKNDQIYSYQHEDLPADWNENDDYFEHLNKTYPPGLCVTIEYEGMYIQITAPDSLGGKYAQYCKSLGGLGVANWVWSHEEVVVGESAYEATVLGQCESDAADGNCFTASYGISMGDKGHVVIHGDDPILFEILRTYRSAPKTDLYCPKPAPTRLEVGGFAYVNTDPPLSYNNVHQAPGINQTLIGKIEPGRAVQLLEGPICNNSLQWWKVRVSNTTFEGWTPEGDHKRYWLVPCESKENCRKTSSYSPNSAFYIQ